ncbi:DUF427 domain-containing protein [Halomonas maura]|uniref:DUF427 domain-containing protein n=1 Tax=Halomonas maura TaxID=117606 RepID=UPI0025B2DECD|nr:DUF427 domain-containing protein [Halomonas maura]MDN3558139.1 DUF427 domain-containing protein [Halomonas maura]
MADYSTDPCITLHPHNRRLRILDGNTLIADTRNGIELSECGYPHRQYVPREGVDMSRFSSELKKCHRSPVSNFRGGYEKTNAATVV